MKTCLICNAKATHIVDKIIFPTGEVSNCELCDDHWDKYVAIVRKHHWESWKDTLNKELVNLEYNDNIWKC